MHNIFKKMKAERIELTDGYHLETDGFKGLTLVFEENRLKKNKKSGKEEPYLFRDMWYFPTLSQVFSKYLMVTTNEAKSLEDLKEILERVEDKIDNMKDYF